jgi:leader peptidase (prepilin peptidase) / N-methyltransferase
VSAPNAFASSQVVRPTIPNRIGLRGALVLAAAAFAFVALPFEHAILATVTSAFVIVLAAIDIERRVIPNRIVLPGTVLVLALHIAVSPGHASEWLIAAVLAGAVLAIPALAGTDWLGMGDAKLAMLIGAALGWGVLGAVFVALMLTIPVSLSLLLRDGAKARNASLPFGPFLAAGAVLLMFGPTLAGI